MTLVSAVISGYVSLLDLDRSLEIAEATPLTRTLDLASPTTLDMMKIFVESPNPSPELKKQLQSLLAIHREVIDTGEKIVSLRQRAGEYRERMDELNDQIVSLRKVKKAGALMDHHLEHVESELDLREVRDISHDLRAALA